MRVALYSLTRDRLDFTKHCFELLRKKAGVPFDHFVVDNGSTDGTVDWLRNEYKPYALIAKPRNFGISLGSNMALNAIFTQTQQYTIVGKVDNDAEVVSENIVGQMCEILIQRPAFGPMFVLSPRVEGIARQPERVRETQLAGRRIGLTSIVGGLFHCTLASIYALYRYPENLPLASGQDDHFCQWARLRGCEVGYVEGLVVNHYLTTDGQCKRDPEYFIRKWQDEKTYFTP